MSEPCSGDLGGQWLPDETGVMPGGDVDDDQIGASYSVRFRRADRPGAMITRTVYPVSPGGRCDGPFLVRIETQWLVSSVPEDPGGKEVWSDSFTEDEAGSHRTAAEAGSAAQDVAHELLHDAGSLTWDGFAQWES